MLIACDVFDEPRQTPPGSVNSTTTRAANGPIAVTSILDRWISPDYRYFKLLGGDACEYMIRHDMNMQAWELVYYRHPDARGKD